MVGCIARQLHAPCRIAVSKACKNSSDGALEGGVGICDTASTVVGENIPRNSKCSNLAETGPLSRNEIKIDRRGDVFEASKPNIRFDE